MVIVYIYKDAHKLPSANYIYTYICKHFDLQRRDERKDVSSVGIGWELDGSMRAKPVPATADTPNLLRKQTKADRLYAEAEKEETTNSVSRATQQLRAALLRAARRAFACVLHTLLC